MYRFVYYDCIVSPASLDFIFVSCRKINVLFFSLEALGFPKEMIAI